MTPAEASAIEHAELEAWRDLYRATPPAFREQFNPELIEIGGVVLTRCNAIPFVHFNAVTNLGMGTPATEETVDAAIAAYQHAGAAKMIVYHHPLAEPAAIPEWLRARGFQEKSGWDRVYRFAGGSAPAPPSRGTVFFVTAATAGKWAAFLDAMYRLPTGPWLLELVERPGWVHAALERDGKMVAVRSLFTSTAGAWLGIEAPIPGLMGPSFEDDHCLLHALVAEGVRRGVTTWAADVEAPNPDHSGPAYDRWRALGFQVAYHRSHFVKSFP